MLEAPRYADPMTPRISKAVIPAAGLGTRFLPATKAMPKEMLPVVDKPAIQYVVEEAVGVGLTDVLMITGRNKNALENHFDRVGELEATLEAKGDTEKLAKVEYSTGLADMHYVRQGDPLGLGHAVLRAHMHVGRQPFAVLLGDDIIDPRDPLLGRMIEVHEARQTSVIALLEVDPGQAHLYGVATVEPTAAMTSPSIATDPPCSTVRCGFIVTTSPPRMISTLDATPAAPQPRRGGFEKIARTSGSKCSSGSVS